MRDLSIYIHIPFCVRKCLYCDFLSFGLPEYHMNRGTSPCNVLVDSVKHYVNLLKLELVSQAAKYRNHRVISVFWGGGTPSLLAGEEVCSIMDILWQHYHVAPDVEITMEANPGTITAEKLRSYITAGINRLSIGLQSADDAELARIGRIHDYRTFLETYRLAREAGFHNINIDLMSALPGQSVASYEATLRRAAELAPEHISAYSLILEEGTPLYERQEEYQFPSEEEDREMYLLTDSYLSSCGYHRYEISNYAREGYECRHNKVYWQRGDYAGFGLGSASMVCNVRWSNPADWGQYEMYVNGAFGDGVHLEGEHADSGDSVHPVGEHVVSGDNVHLVGEHVVSGERTAQDGQTVGAEKDFVPERQILTRREQMEEFMFLGLRMMCGISRREFAGLFGQEIEEIYGVVLDKMYRQQLLTRESDRIRLTARGIDVSNYVMAEFLLDF